MMILHGQDLRMALGTKNTLEGARECRDHFLALSDSKVWPDYVPDAWRTYRQALRDLPAQAGFPENVTWPTEPS